MQATKCTDRHWCMYTSSHVCGREYTCTTVQRVMHMVDKILLHLYKLPCIRYRIHWYICTSNYVYGREDTGRHIQATMYTVENTVVRLYKEYCIRKRKYWYTYTISHQWARNVLVYLNKHMGSYLTFFFYGRQYTGTFPEEDTYAVDNILVYLYKEPCIR